MAVTAFYASIAALFFVILSLRVIGQRRRAKVALGEGRDRTLRRRLRVHGNFAEYVPLALVLMASIREQIEVTDVPAMARGMGLVLIIAGSLSLAFMGFAGLLSS